MKIDVLCDVAVSFAADRACAYPQPAVAADGSVVCVYRRAQEKHSYDGVLVSQRSADLGQTWSPATIVFDGQKRQPPHSPSSSGLCLCEDGSLLAILCATEVTRPDTYVYSEEGLQQQEFVITTRSTDHGHSWDAPRCLEADFAHLGPGANPVLLADGTLFLHGEHPFEHGQLGVCASLSRDHGANLEPVQDLIVDRSGTFSHCDARFAVFGDGDVLGLLWTFRQSDEKTVEVHRSVSSDNAETWSAPQPVGYLGQITDPLILGGDTVLAASNYRWPPEGIRLWLSRDRGQTWPVEESVQMWDAREKRTVAEPRGIAPRKSDTAVWNALPEFTFGTPTLNHLPDGSILLTYYARHEGREVIRACRMLVELPESSILP